MLVVIKGAGDLASGVACRLKNVGMDIIMLETKKPTTVRRTVAFSPAVYENTAKVEDIIGKFASNSKEALEIIKKGNIAVMVDPKADVVGEIQPHVVVDAILAKENIGTKKDDASIVVALGPGFTGGLDCDCVVETKRGHNLGRCIYEGRAAENTGIPGNIIGYTSERILRAPCDGIFEPISKIGDIVKKGQTVAKVDGMPLKSNLDGVVRGMLQYGVCVHKGMKSGDVDPRGIIEYCYTVSDKGRAIAGGVLEAILHLDMEV